MILSRQFHCERGRGNLLINFESERTRELQRLLFFGCAAITISRTVAILLYVNVAARYYLPPEPLLGEVKEGMQPDQWSLAADSASSTGMTMS